MGAPEEEFIAGDDCEICEGTLWESGGTPKYMKCVFKNILKCHPSNYNPPIDKLLTLTQNNGAPCWWSSDIWLDEKNWEILYSPNYFVYPDKYWSYLLLNCSSVGGGAAFGWLAKNTCLPGNGNPVNNQLLCVDGAFYEGGTATVFWQPDDIPKTLCSDYGFHPIEGNLHDRLLLPDNEQCIRIANRADKTNVLFRVDEREF